MSRDETLHYVQCGLDYVYLTNGFEVKETPYGCGYRIHAIDELHEAIALDITQSNRPIRGQELKFLRSMLGLSQEALGHIISKSRAAVARWEGKRADPIDPTADKLLRAFYLLKKEGCDQAFALIDLFSRIDDLEHGYGQECFVEKDGLWKRAA